MKTTSLVIRPEIVAQKLDALRNFAAREFAKAVAACPRLIELLWFLQWFSLQPGGLAKFVENFLAMFGCRIGTDAMHKIGKTDQLYTAQERQEVIGSFPDKCSFSREGDPARQDQFTAEPAKSHCSVPTTPLPCCRSGVAVTLQRHSTGLPKQLFSTVASAFKRHFKTHFSSLETATFCPIRPAPADSFF